MADIVGGSVGFAERAHERAERSPAASASNEWAARQRAARIRQTAETVRRARASQATRPDGRPRSDHG